MWVECAFGTLAEGGVKGWVVTGIFSTLLVVVWTFFNERCGDGRGLNLMIWGFHFVWGDEIGFEGIVIEVHGIGVYSFWLINIIV